MLKAIQIQDYWVIVSDEEIKAGDYIVFNKNIVKVRKETIAIETLYKISKKLIAHKPIGNAPIIEGIALFDAPWEEDVEKLATDTVRKYQTGYAENKVGFITHKNMFIKGYNKHAEKYKWTDEDIENAMQFFHNSLLEAINSLEMEGEAQTETYKKIAEKYIQSLNKKEYEVTLEEVDGKVIIKNYKQI